MDKKLVKFGNTKLPSTTAIFNMGTSKDCPSRLKGLCKCATVCYARKPEKRFPNTVPAYRKRQAKTWLSGTAESIAAGIIQACGRKKVKLFRFNESGDFYSQSCVNKLSAVASILREKGIITYGYTARKDLDFSAVSFRFKGSGYAIKGSTGQTAVFKSKEDVPADYTVCSGSCKTCSICASEDYVNIAFIQH